jgi:hypothetical protein
VSVIDDIKDRIARDPVFAHACLFRDRHPNQPAPFHADMILLLHGPSERVCVLSFRGSAKSTLAEEAIIIKALTGAHQYCVVVCATLSRAIDRLRSIKHEFTNNEMIEELYGPQEGETWQVDRAVLSNGVCIDAIGAGQSTRGLKYLSYRPSYALVDDLEEMNLNLDNVSTPEKRKEISDWYTGVFLPSLSRPSPSAPPALVRICGTALHPESLISRMSKSPDYESLTVPVRIVDASGNDTSSWPSQFPLPWILETRARYEREGQLATYLAEFECQASVPSDRPFREEMFVFEPRVRTFEPVYVIYDPARTAVQGRSCATGMVAASWFGGKLLVWEAVQAFWTPTEIIDSIFKKNDEYAPIEIGFEETGLSQWAMQPLRQAQIMRGSIPLRAINPPKGPGKENFLLRLEPFFAAHEIIFCGSRSKFQKLIDELLGFPYGLVDTINALAYMLEIRPGEPIYSIFRNDHVVDGFQPSRRADPYLLIHSDGIWSCGILVEALGEGLRIIADWCEEGGLAQMVPSVIRAARARAGRDLPAYCPPIHWRAHDRIGLWPAASSAGQMVMQGGDLTLGQAEVRRLLAFKLGDTPLFQVAREASWTVRAMSGGYARAPGESEAMPGPYRLIGESLESFATVLSGAAQEHEGANFRFTKDGRKFLSSTVPLGRERKRESA